MNCTVCYFQSLLNWMIVYGRERANEMKCWSDLSKDTWVRLSVGSRFFSNHKLFKAIDGQNKEIALRPLFLENERKKMATETVP